MDLKLVLKKHWFDLIESGEKKHEYRAFTDYWQARLMVAEGRVYKQFDNVIFYLGYAKNRKQITRKWIKTELIHSRTHVPENGEIIKGMYFRIHLGM